VVYKFPLPDASFRPNLYVFVICSMSGHHHSFTNIIILNLATVGNTHNSEINKAVGSSVASYPDFRSPNPDFWRIFWIRSRIGYHFCSSRIRIIQNATLGTLFIFSRFDFFLQKLFDNLRLERSDAG